MKCLVYEKDTLCPTLLGSIRAAQAHVFAGGHDRFSTLPNLRLIPI